MKTPLKIIQSTEHKKTHVSTSNFHAWFGDQHVLNGVNLNIESKKITCVLGPSGSGKSTLLRSINRINDDINTFRTEGDILLNQQSIYNTETDICQLRTKVGMVFQSPCVFPVSIKENVLFGIQHHQKLSKNEKADLTEELLKSVSLWSEVSHRLNDKASSLSVGQQQRLCIARSLAINPEVLLMDEPTSSLDPVSTKAIEKLTIQLKKQLTIIFVTHNIQQAKRIADHVVFLKNGLVVEQKPSEAFFNDAQNEDTKEFLAHY